jgi:multidrug resistance protein MdtO
MATLAQTIGAPPSQLHWFWAFLREELAPYPGRAGTVARMVIAATLAMIICMTFRIPYGFQAAIYALIVSRENPRSTLESAGIMSGITAITAAYILISAWFVISVPVLHFLWIILTFFAAFYALSTITNYLAVTMFANMISVAVPLWDRHVSAETNVEDTLRVVLAASIGVVVTAMVELGFARMKPGDNVVVPIVRRLATVQSLLACYIEDRPVDQATEAEITRLAVLGTSRLRRLLRRSDYSLDYRSQMSGVVALVGGLVDVAATLTQFRFEPSGTDQKQFRDLATTVAGIRTDLMNRRIPASIQFRSDDKPSHAVPLLLEMEKIVTLIPQAFAGSRSIDEYLPASDDVPGPKLFLPDAFTNPEHFRFALKGCLAASLCYIIYNSIAWPGISTAVTTCLLTGLSTIGASRQKQILRFNGALVGGFLIGMGSQIFILPYLDSIAGFTVFFILVTAFSSWFMTASPRLSYFGLQAALAFYLINLQGFAMERSLSIARDRVVGILLGLFIMWLVFDQLWGARAGVEMKRAFISGLRLLADFAKEPLSKDLKVAVARSYTLRETINSNFDQVRSLADAVLFEFASSQQQDLALRTRIRQWQPRLRTLFIIRTTLLKYRLQLPGFELPEAVRLAQQKFDDQSAKMLEGMADRLDGKPPRGDDKFEDSFEQLQQIVRSCCSEGPQELLTPNLQTFLALSRNTASLTMSLSKEI